MTTLAKFVVQRAAAREVSDFAVVMVFSLIGLITTLIAARPGMDVAGGAE